jgi:hypothetical protein
METSLLPTGSEIETHWSLSEYGKRCIIPILIMANSPQLEQGMSQRDRLIKLNQIAIHQMQVLEDSSDRKLLK